VSLHLAVALWPQSRAAWAQLLISFLQMSQTLCHFIGGLAEPKLRSHHLKTDPLAPKSAIPISSFQSCDRGPRIFHGRPWSWMTLMRDI